MGFLRQTKYEIKNILMSRFLLIIGILMIAAGAAIPVIGLFGGTENGGIDGPIKPYAVREYVSAGLPIDKPIGGDQDTITIDGFVIGSDNPFFWQLSSLISEKESLELNESQFSAPAVLDLVLELIDQEIQYYLRFARNVANYQDYRVDLAWRAIESLHDKFFFEHQDTEESVLLEAGSYRKGMDPDAFRNKYILISAAERQAGLDKADENLQMIAAIVDSDDFPLYIRLRIALENDQIAMLQENIAIQNQAILDNPSQEDNINAIIEELKKQITLIETNNIPVLQYRLEKNIKPGENIWQNNALNDIENSRSQLAYLVIMTEEEYNSGNRGDYYYKEAGSGSYQEYVRAMQKQIDELNKTMIIAQKSLDSDRPDMKYVPDGARNRTIQFLQYSIMVALFGVLIGGWLIASEYQQGTIRLLMIRPKTRTKILLAKFSAALLLCLFVDLAGSLLNVAANGICYGFGDFGFPNYTVTGEVGFAAYFVPRLLACILPILFAFAVAFMLSVIVKNIAVSIAVPIVLFIASVIIMNVFAYRPSMAWIAYTPIPFIQMASFFMPYSPVQQIIQNGIPLSIPYGIILLLVMSAVCTGISVLVFKKRDIVN